MFVLGQVSDFAQSWLLLPLGGPHSPAQYRRRLVGIQASGQHEIIQDVTAGFLKRMASNDHVPVEPHLEPLSGEQLSHRTAIRADAARSAPWPTPVISHDSLPRSEGTGVKFIWSSLTIRNLEMEISKVT